MPRPNSRPKLPRVVKWTVWILVLLLITFAGSYWFIGSDGRRAWKNAVARYESNGGSLELKDFVPQPPPPDSDNFAAIPALRGITIPDGRNHPSGLNGNTIRFQLFDATAFFDVQRLVSKGARASGMCHSGRPIDLTTWATALFEHQPDLAKLDRSETGDLILNSQKDAADVVLAILDANLGEILFQFDEAATRPKSLLVPRPSYFHQIGDLDQFDRHRDVTGILGRILNLRATGAIHTDNSETALLSILASIHLVSAESPPDIGLIQHLYFISFIHGPMAAIAEGMARRTFSGSELVTLQQRLEEIDLFSDLEWSMRIELLNVCPGFDQFKTEGTSLPWWFPSGWVDHNRAIFLEKAESIIIEPAKQGDFALFVDRKEAFYDWLGNNSGPVFDRKTGLAATVIHPFFQIPDRTAYAQAVVNQAAAACALERYFLSHGEYPQSLESLVPEFCNSLPVDPIDNRPLRFKKTEDGRYLLYSIGSNRADDGGIPAWFRGPKPTSSPPVHNREEGDWVWSYQDLSRITSSAE